MINTPNSNLILLQSFIKNVQGLFLEVHKSLNSNPKIDGVSMIPGGSTYSESFTMAMDTNNVYSFYVSWEEDLSTAEIKLHWNETGSMAAVQSQYFILPDEVVNGNITIACQSGYAVQASDPSSCTDVCGDGILTSGETCDDRNIVSGDGCSSDCQTIENNYICVYNSGLPGHECSSCGTSGYPNTAKDACILCSSGYQHASSNLNTCTQICGDGIQVSGETCDDGNSLSGDGCSKECQIEEHYKCTGQPSVCKVDKIKAEQSVEAVGQAVSISISVGMTSQVALSFSLGQSPSSIWMLINISQILQYTAMLTLYFPKLLISSYRHLSIANFDISIFPNVFTTLFDKSLIEGRDSFDYRFANQNIESTNIFLNCGDVVFLLILFLFLNIIIALLSATCKACKCKKDSEDKRGFCRRIMSHFISRVIQIKNDFFFNSILRVIFEVYLPLSFASIYNTYDMKLENYIDYFSHAVSIFFIIIFVLVLAIIPIILWCRKVSKTQQESGRIRILFKDLKNDKKIVVLDNFFLLLRKLSLSLLLIFGWNHGIVQISIMITIGFLIVLWKIIVRPYQSKLLNFQDILFESLLLSILVLYLNFCSKSSELSTSGFSHICGFICLVLIVWMTIMNYTIAITLFFKNLKKSSSKASVGVKPQEAKNTKFDSTRQPGNPNLRQENINFDSRGSNNLLIRSRGKGVKCPVESINLSQSFHRPLTNRLPLRDRDHIQLGFFKKGVLCRSTFQ
ncbi:unnamed protein product [Moneuplotes crassus]|uniref:Uncharacterized protein n=1 Tax=Euplotes crassus TaxID=5936 RepID=A0AAD1Y7D7_EUPCR|nr:unnamed protein product [Moneuplotes crassus]